MTRKILPALTLVASALAFAPAYAMQFDFGVYLDDKRIGHHTFTVTADDVGNRIVRSDASFDVRFLMVPVFRYRHTAEERWQDGCLQQIASQTTVNGKDSALRGSRAEDVFALQVTRGKEVRDVALPACVSTFAYWDIQTLQQHTQLLNSQTGSYEAVTFDQPSQGRLTINGGKFVIDLEYAASQWQGLSTLRDGRRLEYRLEPAEGPTSQAL